MGRKKNGYIREKYESDIPGNSSHDTYVAMYTSMMNKPVFMSLTGNQKYLYTFCRWQKYNNENNPGKVYPEWKECQNPNAFFMNWDLAKKFHLYKSETTFYRDLKQLVESGFIDCLYSGRKGRNKSIYIYSDRWRNYKPKI